MKYKEIELTDGRTVRVYRPPTTRIIESVQRRHPEPQPPVVTETTKAGADITMTILDDPEYLRQHAEWQEVVNEETDQMSSLLAFKDVVVPDDWSLEDEVGEEVRYFEPDWEPREGAMGRKLDYIQWNILGDVVNSSRFIDALRELSGIDLEGVRRNEDSFRDQVEGPAA